MPFGQTSGPPASNKQLALLSSLLATAGYDDFRSARHAFGLTQRQAGGRFSVAEASALIDRLQGTETGEAPAPFGSGAVGAGRQGAGRDDLRDTREAVLRGMPAELLAEELERRSWVVIPPP